MTQFTGDNLEGSHFERVDLTGSRFRSTDLSRTLFENVDFTEAVFRGVDLINVHINGEIENLLINGVDVAPLVDAELDRRDPLRVKMRPTTADGFREAWDIILGRWDATFERASALRPELLFASVGGEWSFIETLRHLLFATDAWVGRTILQDRGPWHPLGLAWREMPETPGVPRDYDACPSLDEVLALRLERTDAVSRVLEELTDDSLHELTVPVEDQAWPPAESLEVARCLRVVLNEEFLHRDYAERDLALLEAHPATSD